MSAARDHEWIAEKTESVNERQIEGEGKKVIAANLRKHFSTAKQLFPCSGGSGDRWAYQGPADLVNTRTGLGVSLTGWWQYFGMRSQLV